MAQEILSYLIEHPDAEDTLEGIAEWWLLERAIRRHRVEVQVALTELAARKLILERQASDGQVYYRLNPRKIKQIVGLVKPPSA